jgi:hypothetical protein
MSKKREERWLDAMKKGFPTEAGLDMRREGADDSIWIPRTPSRVLFPPLQDGMGPLISFNTGRKELEKVKLFHRERPCFAWNR